MFKKDMPDWSFLTDVKELQELLSFWNQAAIDAEKKSAFYKEETRQAQEILGRVIQQFSERWDSVKLTNHPRERHH